MRYILAFFKAIFGAFSKTENQKPIDPVKKPESISVPQKTKLLSREELNNLANLLIEGKIKNSPYGPYLNWRETSGSNKSPDISPMIIRQGGTPGDPYCQFGRQDEIDGLAQYLEIPRKKWPYPEGGSTQRVHKLVDPKYKTLHAKVMCLWTVNYNGGSTGHIERICKMLSVSTSAATTPGDKFLMHGFNTNIDADQTIVRNGQGAGWVNRTYFKTKQQGSDKITSLEFVDLYLIYVDAHKAHFG